MINDDNNVIINNNNSNSKHPSSPGSRWADSVHDDIHNQAYYNFYMGKYSNN